MPGLPFVDYGNSSRPYIKTTKPIEVQADLDLLAKNDVNKKVSPDWKCSLCRTINEQSQHLNITPSPPYGPELVKYHASEEEMRQAILEGCHLCSLLNNYIPAGASFPLGLLITGTYTPGRSSLKRTACWLQLGTLTLPQDYAAFGPKLELWEEDGKEMELWGRHEAQLSISTASDASFDQARKWISFCCETHTSCDDAYTAFRHRKPTRLLDVGDYAIRLCLTEELPPASDLEYLTLSHCWGNASILKLTQGNLDQLRQSIDFHDLPLTFQHAVIATRRLGFRYIWIDSLCIIQDSARDWEQESAVMGDIYRGGICNISAVAAADSNAGFFSARNPLAYIPCRLGAMEKLSPVTKSKPAPSNLDGRLSTRGWVMQERAMSPRTLHFGSTGLAWECLSQRVNEKEWLSGISPKIEFGAIGIPSLASLDLANPDRHTRRFYGAWTRLLASYSRCDLTVPGDRLVAFNAIVADASRRTGLTAVAGLWKELLLVELLWYRTATNPPQNIVATSCYIAPSWSWGAVASGVQSSYAELLDTRATLKLKAAVTDVHASHKPNGQVTDGYLRLVGPSRTMKWAGDSESETLRKSCHLDGRTDHFDELHVVHVVRAIGENLHLVRGRIEESMEDRGLLLQSVDGRPGVFRRVGVFQQEYIGEDPLAVFAESKSCEAREFMVV